MFRLTLILLTLAAGLGGGEEPLTSAGAGSPTDFKAGLLAGRVYSQGGSPLPYTVVQHNRSKAWTLTDEGGRFHLLVQSDDTLTFSRYGYAPKTLPVKSSRRVQLSPEPITLPPLTIVGLRQPADPSRFTVVNRDLDRQSRSSLFQQIPGLALKTYGGAAGVASLRLEGGPASHTKILLDGVDLTSPQNGSTDFSQIPGAYLDQVTLTRTPGVWYGSGAIDGALLIKPWKDRSLLTISRGSFGYRSNHGNLRWRAGRWSLNLSGGGVRDKGNYPVTWRQQVFNRRNNAFQRRFGSLRVEGRPGKRVFLRGWVLDSHQERGVAGLVQAPNQKAHRSDRVWIAALTSGYVFKSGWMKLHLDHWEGDETYTDPGLALHSRHRITTSTLRMVFSRRVSQRFKYHTQGEWKLEALASSEAGDHRRTTRSLAGKVDFHPAGWITLSPALRQDWWDRGSGETSGDLQLVWQAAGWPDVVLSTGKTFRQPTFNDLYWQPGGNRNLRPERSTYRLLEVSPSWGERGGIKFIISDRYSRNLIRWQPGEPTWEAVNVQRTRRTGYSFQVRVRVAAGTLQGHLNRTVARDLATNQPLRYAPEFTGLVGATWDGKRLGGGLQVHHTGKQVALINWPTNSILPGFTLVTARLSYKGAFFQDQAGLQVVIENLLNTRYMSVMGYPEPGRSFRIALTYLP